MREPWLFWGSLSFLVLAAICFVVALRAASSPRVRRLEIFTQVIAGAAAVLMGYESAFRTSAASIHELQINTAIGLLFLTFGILSLLTAVAKSFNR